MKRIFSILTAALLITAVSCNKTEFDKAEGMGALNVDARISHQTRAMSQEDLLAGAVVNIYKADYYPYSPSCSLFHYLKNPKMISERFIFMIRGAKTTATILISFMSMLSEGPAVSLRGSPTVSPVIAAL